MHSTVSVDVAAPPGLVFRLARDVERWPRLLPHYRSVAVLARSAEGTTLRMVARRPLIDLLGIGLPVVWRAQTWAEPEQLRLRFRHLGGATAGMDVTWRIDATPSGCHVAIDHEFRRHLPIPLVGDLLGDEVFPAFVDRFFTRPIARRTLATFGVLAEAIGADATSNPSSSAYPTT
ncbi:MAG: type II toxin-antitoxin system RatA family toxin [Candidatus Limnocylindrales bacterium]